MRLEFDKDGYVCCILYGCTTGSCEEYSGRVPTQPEAYADMDDWADRALVQAYYLDASGNLAYDATRAAAVPDEDALAPYSAEQLSALGITAAIQQAIQAATPAFDTIYPVGSIYMSVNATSPETLFGGTWVQIEDTFLLAAGSSFAAGTSGGAQSHKHVAPIGYASSNKYLGTLNVNGTTEDFDSVGGYNSVARDAGGTSIPDGIAAYYTQTVNHMPPYLAVYVWQRTA